MNKKCSEIVDDFSELKLLNLQQGPDNSITRVSDIKTCEPGDLVFIESEKFVSTAYERKPSAIVTRSDLVKHFDELAESTVIVSPNVKLAQALILQAYADRDVRANGWPRVHTSAVIHESVSIPDSVTIGPGAVIAKNVVLGDNCCILANTVLEENVRIGCETVLHPNVTIGYDCVIGDRCIIKSGAVIGMEGFGFAQDQQQKSYRVPQIGNVVIGNDVVIGANCTIDRAAFLHTHIGDGCKFDTLVHIAHNVEVGEDGLIASQTAVAGSTTIGKRIRCSGQVGILDHIKICDNTMFVARAGVSNNVNQPGIYGGAPVQPLKKFRRNIAVFKQLDELKKTVKSLEKE